MRRNGAWAGGQHGGEYGLMPRPRRSGERDDAPADAQPSASGYTHPAPSDIPSSIACPYVMSPYRQAVKAAQRASAGLGALSIGKAKAP